MHFEHEEKSLKKLLKKSLIPMNICRSSAKGGDDTGI